MAVVFEVDVSALRPLIQALRASPKVIKRVTRDVVERGVKLARHLATEKVSGPVLKRRTGMLAKSITSKVEQDAEAIYGRLGLNVASSVEPRVLVYAAAHEFGTAGPITPKKAKVLTIPLEAALTRAGVARFTAREAESQYPGGTFWKRSRKGNLILFGKLTKGQRHPVKGGRRTAKAAGYDPDLVPLFVGKTSVPAITPKRYLASSVEEVMPHIADAIGVQLQTKLLGESGA